MTATSQQCISIRSDGRSIEYERLTFSGGEVHVRIAQTPDEVARVTARVRSSADFMEMLMVTDALRRRGCSQIHLVIPYLPYARQDRVCAIGEALSLRVVCDIINAQNYASVTVWDAHSDTALALLDRVINVSWKHLFRIYDVMPDLGRDDRLLVAPDAGALKKIEAFSKATRISYVRADKTRNPVDGSIGETIVHSGHVGAKSFFILDDICDGGKTFIELAKVLRPLTDGKIYLYVTHGIFSKGTSVFDGLIDHVFVANPFIDDLPSNFTFLD